MKTILGGLFLLLFIFSLSRAEYQEEDDVIILNDANFDEYIK